MKPVSHKQLNKQMINSLTASLKTVHSRLLERVKGERKEKETFRGSVVTGTVRYCGWLEIIKGLVV